MTPKEKVSQLQQLIQQTLTSRIDRDYVLLDIPIHVNVGDILIWQGVLDFLKKCGHRCLFSKSLYCGHIDIPKDVLILFQGGGNFGDIWPASHNFRKKIIEQYPENPVLILPQSVHYNDEQNLQADAQFFSRYTNVTICVRDYSSKELLEKYFTNEILLVPDMAFMIDIDRYPLPKMEKGSSIFCKRFDKESVQNSSFSVVPDDAAVQDWLYPVLPSMEKEIYWGHRISNSIDIRIGTKLYDRVVDWLWKYKYKKLMIQHAIDFVSPYESIYTTRLHVAILSVILNKEKVVLFDNNYGKLSSFYHTWFEDLDGIQLL